MVGEGGLRRGGLGGEAGGEEGPEFIDKTGGRWEGEGETMFGIKREQTIICID